MPTSTEKRPASAPRRKAGRPAVPTRKEVDGDDTHHCGGRSDEAARGAPRRQQRELRAHARTSGLDPLLQDEFQSLVRETVAEGRTVFLSSHELDEVQRLMDRLAITKEGSIVVTDTVDGLRKAAPRTV
jgi:ABC-type histidine transport system ATPase subunit